MPVGAFVPSRIHLDYPEWQAPLIGNVGQVWAYDGTGYVPTSFLLSSTVSAFGATLIDDADAATARTTLGLGTVATLNVGTSANNIVQLDSSARLPAVDGSQLTGITAAAAGSTTQVIYNASGVYAGDAGMTYNASTDRLTVAGGLVAPSTRPASDSATALQLQNASGTAVVTVDTTNSRVGINRTPAGTNALVIQPSGGDGFIEFRNSSGLSLAELTYSIGLLFNALGSSGLEFRTSTTIGTGMIFGLRNASAFYRIQDVGGYNLFATTAAGLTSLITPTATNNAVVNTLTLKPTLTTGTVAAGFGVAYRAQLRSTTTDDQDAGRLTWEWVTATHASRASRGKLTAYYTSTEQEAMTWDGGTGGLKLAFYGGTPVARQVLATGAGATVDDVITALQNLGLLKQS